MSLGMYKTRCSGDKLPWEARGTFGLPYMDYLIWTLVREYLKHSNHLGALRPFQSLKRNRRRPKTKIEKSVPCKELSSCLCRVWSFQQCHGLGELVLRSVGHGTNVDSRKGRALPR
jgi:hypothetical protein